MSNTAFNILIYNIPVLLIIIFILSIILFRKRNKIIEKYNVGYISSFLFAAYMLSPITIGIPAIFALKSSNNSEGIFAVIMSLGYSIIGLIIFAIVYRKKSFKYKLGKLFAMLGIGVCAGYILIFWLLKYFFHADGGGYESPSTQVPSFQGGNFYDETGHYAGQIDKHGNKYDTLGRYTGRIDKNGNQYDAAGKYQGCIDKSGYKYDNAGRGRGHIDKSGNSYSETGKYQGQFRS